MANVMQIDSLERRILKNVTGDTVFKEVIKDK